MRILMLCCVAVLWFFGGLSLNPAAGWQTAASSKEEQEQRLKVPTREEVLAAIERFRAAPLSKEAVIDAQKIMAFTQFSDLVDVKLNFRYTPWARGNIPELAEDKLIGAFVAGNIEYQLLQGLTEHRPYEGTVFQLAVYEALRSKNLAPKIKRMEMLLQYQAEGVLERRIR